MAGVHTLRISIVLILIFYIHVIKAPPTVEDRTSIISVFQDSYCQTIHAKERTSQVAFSGDCHTILDGVNSVETMEVAIGCQGT